jgi:hypothetical protein
MLRLLITTLAFTVLSAATAHAQLLSPLLPGERDTPPENALQRAETERVYQRALKNIPDKKVSKDPWNRMRSATPESFDRHARPQ